MGITAVSSREFNQDVSRVKQVAVNGPVFRTDRGHPSHVLLTIEEYQKSRTKKKALSSYWLNAHVLPGFSERILNVDIAVVQYCAKLHVSDPRSDRDRVFT